MYDVRFTIYECGALLIRVVAVAANRLQPPNFTWNCVKFFAVAMAMTAKFALFHIKFVAVSLARRHRNKSRIFFQMYKIQATVPRLFDPANIFVFRIMPNLQAAVQLV